MPTLTIAEVARSLFSLPENPQFPQHHDRADAHTRAAPTKGRPRIHRASNFTVAPVWRPVWGFTIIGIASSFDLPIALLVVNHETHARELWISPAAHHGHVSRPPRVQAHLGAVLRAHADAHAQGPGFAPDPANIFVTPAVDKHLAFDTSIRAHETRAHPGHLGQARTIVMLELQEKFAPPPAPRRREHTRLRALHACSHLLTTTIDAVTRDVAPETHARFTSFTVTRGDPALFIRQVTTLCDTIESLVELAASDAPGASEAVQAAVWGLLELDRT